MYTVDNFVCVCVSAFFFFFFGGGGGVYGPCCTEFF